jgi:predicted Zn-dependent protease
MGCGLIGTMRHPTHLQLLSATLAVALIGTAVAETDTGKAARGPAPVVLTPPDRISTPATAPPSVQNSLPDLGSSANASLSRGEEYQIGRLMMRDLRSQNAVLDDPESADYLQSLGSRLAIEAQEGQQQFSFFAVRDQSINAFALPGGFIGVNTGLVLLTSSEAELAGVVAHEIGHVVQRHIARAVQAQSRSSLASIAGMLGGVLIGAVTGNVGAMQGLIVAGQGVAMQQQINFTLMEEAEADRVGISYLASAGFDPGGMAAFFSAMSRERGRAGEDYPEMLLDHPVDTKRIAEARARMTALSSLPRRPDSASYAFIRERLRVLGSDSSNDMRRYYEHQRASNPKNGALRYGAALAELKSGDPRNAVTLLEPLVEAQPQLPLLHAALAQALLAAGRNDEARQTFERGLVLSPRNVPLSVRYAEALMQLNEAKKAHQLLLDLFNNVMPTPEQIRLIAIVANAAGDTGDAYYYMAELHIASGDLMLATTQLDLALATPGLTEVQRKRFQARKEEIGGFLREQRGSRASRQQPPG